MRLPQNRILIASVCFLVWFTITFFGWKFFGLISREYFSLGFVERYLPYLSNIAFLGLVIYSWDWRDIGLRPPAEPKQWLVLWFPSVYLVGFAIFAILYGPASITELVWPALYLFPAAVSEELMFRGVLYRALRSRLNLWPAVWISALLFGLVHFGNILHSEDAGVSLFQSIHVMMFGILLVAIAQRTGSIIPTIVYHWLWNLVSYAALNFLPVTPPSDPFDHVKNGNGASSMSLLAIGVVGVIIFQLPNLIYAIYLLRKAAKEERAFVAQAGIAPHASMSIRGR